MLDRELLEILACPETKRGIQLGSPELLAALNARIKSGQLRNRAGQPVTEPVDALLVRVDGKVAYPVRDDIPVLLVEEGIPLD